MKSAATMATLACVVLWLLPGCNGNPGAMAPDGARAGELRFLGQPSADELAQLRDEGIDIVVNLRPDSEMDWDEAAVAAGLGLDYYSVPIARSGAAFERESIERISAIVDANPDRDIVLHCSSGNRVAAWYAVYLVQRHGLSLEEALHTARVRGLVRAGSEKRIEAYLGGR